MIRPPLPQVERHLRDAVRAFLAARPLDRSDVVFDGPGNGCTTHALVLGYLGIDRLLRLRSVHAFSSSAYGPLWLLAKQWGMLTLKRQDAFGWNHANQERHGVTVPGAILLKLPGAWQKGYVFSGRMAEEALACSVKTAFVKKRVRELPENWFFWVHDATRDRLVGIHAAHPEYADWTLGDLVRAMVAVPRLYEPLEKNGTRYRDALFAPTVKEKFRELRRGENVLFWNMTFTTRRPNLFAVKGHRSRYGLFRIVSDTALFMMGVENPEFDWAIARGLFEIHPLPEISAR